MKTVFKITIINWEKHNPNKKKNHRYFLLENRFFEDAKTSQLKPIETLLFIKLLCVAGDLLSNHFEVHAGLMPSRWRMSDQLLSNCCNSLQQLQLISYEKKDSLLIQEKRKEEKTEKEEKLPSDFDLSKNSENQEPENLDFFLQKNINKKKKILPNTEENRKVWDAFCEARVLRYGVEDKPIKTAKHNSIINRFRQQYGTDMAIKLVQFYLSHNNGAFSKNSHPLAMCEKFSDSLISQMQRGVEITEAEMKSYYKALEDKKQMEYFERKFGNGPK
jgi:hypothetical protein